MAVDASQRYVRILEVNPDLGLDLPPAAFEQASRSLTCPMIELEAGKWDLDSSSTRADVRGRLLGCLVVEGLIVEEVTLGGRVCNHLHGPRDLLGAEGGPNGSLPVESRFIVPQSARVALLDDRFLVAARRWPWLVGRLFDAAGQQMGRASTHQAISQLSRVEDRLVALFWHLADRWGVVRPDGIDLDLPLTHEALGRLVGARRPTVSLGLLQLAERGAVARRADGGWRLAHDSLDLLAQKEPVARGMPLILVAPAHRLPAALPEPTPIDVKALRARLARVREQTALNRASHQRNLAQNRRVRERVVAIRSAVEPEAPTSLAS